MYFGLRQLQFIGSVININTVEGLMSKVRPLDTV